MGRMRGIERASKGVCARDGFQSVRHAVAIRVGVRIDALRIIRDFPNDAHAVRIEKLRAAGNCREESKNQQSDTATDQ